MGFWLWLWLAEVDQDHPAAIAKLEFADPAKELLLASVGVAIENVCGPAPGPGCTVVPGMPCPRLPFSWPPLPVYMAFGGALTLTFIALLLLLLDDESESGLPVAVAGGVVSPPSGGTAVVPGLGAGGPSTPPTPAPLVVPLLPPPPEPPGFPPSPTPAAEDEL